MTPEQVRSDRYRLITRLADDLGHEVKNPLHAMVINLELVRRRVQDGQAKDALARVAVVEEQIGRVNELVGALIQLLRPGRDPSAVVDLDAAVEDLLPLVRAQARLAHVIVDYEPSGGAAAVALRRDALRHLVLSLVIRTLDPLRAHAGSRIEIRSGAANGQVHLRVVGHRGSVAGPAAPPPPSGATEGPEELAVARAIAAEAGGALELDVAEDGRELGFVVRFPRAGSA